MEMLVGLPSLSCLGSSKGALGYLGIPGFVDFVVFCVVEVLLCSLPFCCMLWGGKEKGGKREVGR